MHNLIVFYFYMGENQSQGSKWVRSGQLQDDWLAVIENSYLEIAT